jgi:processive 1,2-diacylglycerol beta-glucosyltransferase
MYPGSVTMSRDILDYVPKLMRKSIVSAYRAMTRNAPWLWERIYRDTDIKSDRRPMSAFWNDVHRSVSRTYIKHLFKELDLLDPTAVFSTHFFGMSSLLDKWEHRAPIYFVGTDYLSHSLQRDPRFDGWFVGSDEATRQYRADSVPTSEYSVKNFGIPISRDYLVSPSRTEARRMLEVEDNRRMATVIDCGQGARVLDTVAGSMIDLSDWKIVVICQDNNRMYEHLRDKYFPFKHITVMDYSPNIADYYAASDLVVMNPGGVQIAQASTVGAAMLLLDPLPGLEQYNCHYALERGAAKKAYENRRVGEFIRELIEKSDELDRMKSRARAISRPNSAMDILAWVMNKVEEDDKKRDAARSVARNEENIAPEETQGVEESA